MAGRASVAEIDKIGRIRLSEHFFMRDFLFSEVAMHYGLVNIPDDIQLATEVGSELCSKLLEPMHAKFGGIHVRSAFRSCEVNEICNANKHGCARNALNYAGHIWDRVDGEGRKGATACIVVPQFADRFAEPGDWAELAWWIHDSLPYCLLEFYPTNWAFNVTWSDMPRRRIDSYTGWYSDDGWKQKGLLTKEGLPNHDGDHSMNWSRLAKVFPL